MQVEPAKNKATKSYINAAVEFEKIERILIYLKVSNELINEDFLKSVKKLKAKNKELELPFEITEKEEKEFLEINYYEKTLSSMMYVKTIDNFVNYFKDILAEIVIKEPKILKSKETEQLDFILSFNDYEDLINAIAEKKIESLFYQSIDGIQKFFREKTGIEIFDNKSNEINLLAKQRNLEVHNRGKISKEFKRQFPNEEFKENLHLSFDFVYIQKLVPALYKIVNDLDTKLCTKYHLNEKNFNK